MVSVAIMALITTAVLVQFNGFDSAVVTRARAFDVANAVRATQSYATHIRTREQIDTSLSLQYLITFTRGSSEFVILSQQGAADPQPIEYRELANNYTATALCFELVDGAEHCAPSDGQTLSLAFKRPEVTPYPSAPWRSSTSTILRTRIGIRGAESTMMQWVIVDRTGAISVMAATSSTP